MPHDCHIIIMPPNYPPHALAYATAYAMAYDMACRGICRGMPWHVPWHGMANAYAMIGMACHAYAMACRGICHGMKWHMPWPMACHGIGMECQAWHMAYAMACRGICHGMCNGMPIFGMWLLRGCIVPETIALSNTMAMTFRPQSPGTYKFLWPSFQELGPQELGRDFICSRFVAALLSRWCFTSGSGHSMA